MYVHIPNVSFGNTWWNAYGTLFSFFFPNICYTPPFCDSSRNFGVAKSATDNFLRILYNSKKALISSRLFSCRRWDLNPHDIATTGTWSLRVCQFRHSCEQMIFYRFNDNKSTPIFNFFPFFEKIYKIDKNRKKLKIGIDNCPGICYYLQVVMRRKFIRYAEVSELADEQD